MMRLPMLVATCSILGIEVSNMLPEKFNDFKTDALITLIALAVIFFSDKKEKRFEKLAESIDKLVESLRTKPCMLDKEALKEIFSQENK